MAAACLPVLWHAEDAGYALNCLTLTVTGLAGRGELKTLQKHDQQLLDCLHVAWFWGRLREEDGG